MNKADIEKVGSGLVVNCPVTGTDATKGSLQHAGGKILYNLHPHVNTLYSSSAEEAVCFQHFHVNFSDLITQCATIFLQGKKKRRQ